MKINWNPILKKLVPTAQLLYVINRSTVTQQYSLILWVVNETGIWTVKDLLINWVLIKTVTVAQWMIQIRPVALEWRVHWAKTQISLVPLMLHSFGPVHSWKTVYLLHIPGKIMPLWLAILYTPDMPHYSFNTGHTCDHIWLCIMGPHIYQM